MRQPANFPPAPGYPNLSRTVALRLTLLEQKKNIATDQQRETAVMSSTGPQANAMDDEIEAVVDQAIGACATLANNDLECQVSELMKAVSHAYVRGGFHTYYLAA